jgi:hypothetical protein
MKKLILIIASLLLTSNAFAKDVIDCDSVGFYARLFTTQKSNGMQIKDAQDMVNLNQGFNAQQKQLLMVMAKDIFASPNTMDKDQAADYYQAQCQEGLDLSQDN